MFSSKIVYFFFIILAINEVLTQDCTKPDRPLPPQSCTPLKVGLNPEEKKEILATHNKLRQFLASGQEKHGANNRSQPAAKNIRDLKWDTELEKKAQKWAATCVYEHTSCLQADNMGQNMGYISNNDDSSLKYPDIVKGWYDEVAEFDGSQVEHVTDFGWSTHYTQMISSNTTKVGCGAITYKDDGLKRINLICNYRPFTNMVGNGLYEIKND